MLGDVPEEHTEPAILGICVVKVADTTCRSVGIKTFPTRILAAHFGGKATSRSTVIDAVCLCIYRVLRDIIFLHGLIECHSVYAKHTALNEFAFAKLVHDAENTACPIAFLHAVTLCVGGKHAETGHMSAQFVNVVHAELHFSFLGYSQQMQHRIRASTHGNV